MTRFGTRAGAARAFVRTIVLAIPVLMLTCAAQADEKRVALVIGNSAYQNAGVLPNPHNDAQDMAAALRQIGFEVVDGVDLDKRSMDQALTRFSRVAQDADAAVVFYAGHGLQFQGQNYLIPIDTKLEDEFGLQFETTRVDDVINALERAKGVRILVLDACRNNPFADRLSRSLSRTRDVSVGKGLAKIERSRGMVIAYATQASDVAADGNGRNSPFTAALLKEIQVPDVEVGTLFRRVALDVNRETNGRQTPELSLSLVGEFFFKRGESDTEAFTRLRGSNDVAALSDFVTHYPKSVFVEAAQARLATAERDERLAREQGERRSQLRDQLAKLELDKKKAADELAAMEPPQRGSVQKIAPAQDAGVDVKADAGQKQAALSPAVVRADSARSAVEAPPADRGVVVGIQTELKRVGCFAGDVDDKWTSSRTTRALREFTKFASLPAPKLPTGEFLGTLKEQSGRVCPLVCGTGTVERDGACVAKVCSAGERLDRAGRCITSVVARPHVAPRIERAQRPGRIAEERVGRGQTWKRPPKFQPRADRVACNASDRSLCEGAGVSNAPIEGHRSWH